MTDEQFDALFDDASRLPSSRFWTPVAVALRAAQWLTEGGARRVLDVGSGPGKVCLIGALVTGAQFFGIEQRPHLVDAAREAARRLGTGDRATFWQGMVEDVDLASFDALYFFNPFGENLYEKGKRLDETVELSEERFYRDITLVERLLEGLPVGAHMVTYHGFGGRIADTFDLVHYANIGTDILRLWVKSRPEGQRRTYLVEPTRPTRPRSPRWASTDASADAGASAGGPAGAGAGADDGTGDRTGG